MDIFDQYLYEELVSEYGRSGLTDDDYEELYVRFCNHSYIEEVTPYILAMRFFGLGTPAEPDEVLSELKTNKADNVQLRGLYYDLMLCVNPANTGAADELRCVVEAGYCDKYLLGKSNVRLVKQKTKNENTKPSRKDNPPSARTDSSVLDSSTVEYNTLTNEIALSLLGKVTKVDYGTRSLVLPSTYNKIGKSAFQGIKDIDMLIIPNGFIEIDENAFSWAIIHQIKIPKTVTVIAKNAFKGFTGVIECSADSYAYKYAKRYNVRALVK